MKLCTTHTSRGEITAAVAAFFGRRRVCWATPGTENHSSNLYGDHHICRFTRGELVELIHVYHTFANDDIEQSIEEITADMQFNRPQ